MEPCPGSATYWSKSRSRSPPCPWPVSWISSRPEGGTAGTAIWPPAASQYQRHNIQPTCLWTDTLQKSHFSWTCFLSCWTFADFYSGKRQILLLGTQGVLPVSMKRYPTTRQRTVITSKADDAQLLLFPFMYLRWRFYIVNSWPAHKVTSVTSSFTRPSARSWWPYFIYLLFAISTPQLLHSRNRPTVSLR